MARDFEDWGVPLCKAIDGLDIPGFPEYKVACQYGTEHRCGIKISGPDLSPLITGTDPLKDNKKLIHCKPILEDDPKAIKSSQIINALSDAIRATMKAHEINTSRRDVGKEWANLVLLRGCG